MEPPETLGQTVRRDVDEAQARVAYQGALVAELARQGHDTTAAELLLSTMMEQLLLMRAHWADGQVRAPLKGSTPG